MNKPKFEYPQMLFADVDSLTKYNASYARTVSEVWGIKFSADGVMYIPVLGGLFASASDTYYTMSYTEIEEAIDKGLADDEIKQIVFMIDSPGGEADGVFSLVDRI